MFRAFWNRTTPSNSGGVVTCYCKCFKCEREMIIHVKLGETRSLPVYCTACLFEGVLEEEKE